MFFCFFFISVFELYANLIAETPFAYLKKNVAKSREENSRSTDKIYRVTLQILYVTYIHISVGYLS